MEGTSGPRNPFQRSRAAAEPPPHYEYMLIFQFFSRNFVLIWTTAMTSLDAPHAAAYTTAGVR